MFKYLNTMIIVEYSNSKIDIRHRPRWEWHFQKKKFLYVVGIGFISFQQHWAHYAEPKALSTLKISFNPKKTGGGGF